MQSKLIECSECEAVFRDRYDLDADYYTPQYCTFCGTEIDADHTDDNIDDDQ